MSTRDYWATQSLLDAYASGRHHVTGLVTLDGDPIVWGVYDRRVRWNGWLCPSIDAWSVVRVLDTLNALQDDDYRVDYTWNESGALVLTETQWAIEAGDDYQPQVIEPDGDGLYSLGAHAWVWSAADDVDACTRCGKALFWDQGDLAYSSTEGIICEQPDDGEPIGHTLAPPALCEWFALCDRPATGTTPHPILGAVPTCDRCAERANR
jgi:hypothetical protein